MKTPIISGPLLSLIREGIFPRGCALCGKALRRKKAAFYGLCDSCRGNLAIPAAERGRCSCCGQPLISEAVTCLSCRNGPEHSFDRVLPLFPYTGKYQKILAAYKFGKHLSLGNLFAHVLKQGFELLENELNSNGDQTFDPCWVPVPPRPGKIKNTGWDQIEYLAKVLEKMRLPVQRCLKRLPSESQKELNREKRRENLKNRILVKNQSSATSAVPKTAILFDDVYTTGSTMDACAAVLKSGGTERVYGICLCYD
jgi:ComF family protein